MSNLIGSITEFTGTYAPVDHMFCEGQELEICEYLELFSVIGNRYGGNGTTTFYLPDRRPQDRVGCRSNWTLDSACYIICVEGDYPERTPLVPPST